MTPEIALLNEQVASKRQLRQAELAHHGIYTNIPNTQTFKGKSLLACGNRITWLDKENATFHELILANLRHELGDEWFDAERAKLTADQHFVVQCAAQYEQYMRSGGIQPEQHDNNQYSAMANGYVQVVLSLAFDLYLLRHKNCGSEAVVKRLKTKREYQSARYEIAVASIFARADCSINWIEPMRRGPKTPEFVAHCPLTDNFVAVEAKSKHPRGVMHEDGSFDLQKALRGDVAKLFHSALAKETNGLPYMIFIDMNAPHSFTKTATSQWYKDLQAMMKREHHPTPDDPDIFNELIATNFAPHYDKDRIVSPGQFAVVQPLFVKHKLNNNDVLLGRINMAASEYGPVPNL